MPRNFSPAYSTAVASKTPTLALFAVIAFADNTLYFFSGVGTITPAGPAYSASSTFPYGSTFTGLGWLAKMSSIPQTTKTQAQNITISLSGIPANLVSEATAQVRIPGTCTVWLGLFDSSGNLLKDPIQLFSGSLDVPSLTDGGDTSTISITCENSLLSLNLAPNRKFDDADQQIYFHGDLGMSFVDNLENITLFWPAPSTSGSPYPVYMTVTPALSDIAVGASTTVSITIHYSDGTTYTKPANTGSGPAFIVALGSSNPKVATWQYTSTNNVTGVAPGECAIIAHVPYGSGGSGFSGTYRAACSIIVHS